MTCGSRIFSACAVLTLNVRAGLAFTITGWHALLNRVVNMLQARPDHLMIDLTGLRSPECQQNVLAVIFGGRFSFR